ncbi:MAG: hypothetical protein RLZZ219_1475 [Cyanobacteriota bacterium]|jgi:hypothetical protein
MPAASTAVRPLSHRTSLGLLGALVAAALAPQPAQANMVQQIIVGKCSEAMQADFKKAGKTPPAGMVDFTCSCVSDGMLKRRQSLDQAKQVCVQQATQKYGAI